MREMHRKHTFSGRSLFARFWIGVPGSAEWEIAVHVCDDLRTKKAHSAFEMGRPGSTAANARSRKIARLDSALLPSNRKIPPRLSVKLALWF